MLLVHRPHFDEHTAKMNFVTNTEKLFSWNEIKSRPSLGQNSNRGNRFIPPLAVIFTTLLSSNLHSEVCLSRYLRPQLRAAPVLAQVTLRPYPASPFMNRWGRNGSRADHTKNIPF